MKRPLVATVLVCATLAAASVAALGREAFKSGTFDPPRVAPEFKLKGSNGSPLELKRFRGKVVILEFGFSNCEKICPVTLAKLVEVFKKLGPAASDVQHVFITVDPGRDTPERLREYLAYFNPTFLGATGTNDELSAVDKAYGVLITREESANQAKGYQVHHSSSLYLIDREGKLRVLVPFGKTADDIVHDVRLLLKK